MTNKSLISTLLKNCKEEILIDRFSKRKFDCQLKEVFVKQKITEGKMMRVETKTFTDCRLRITRTTSLVEGVTLDAPKLRLYINDKFIGWIEVLNASKWESEIMIISLAENKFNLIVNL